MTVNVIDTTSGPYVGNDLTTDFSCTFPVQSEGDVAVFETDDQGVETELVLDTDFTVTIVGDQATVTRIAGALPTDYSWYLMSDYEASQETAFNSQGGFFPTLHESAFDKLTLLISQVQEKLGRTLQLPRGESGPLVMPSLLDRTDKLLAFDENGDPTPVDNISEAIALAATANAQTAAAATAAATATAADVVTTGQAVIDAAAEATAAGDSATAADASAQAAATSAAAAATGDPQMTTLERRALVAPVEGLRVFDTEWKTTFTWDGSEWRMTPFTVFLDFHHAATANEGVPDPILTLGDVEFRASAYVTSTYQNPQLWVANLGAIDRLLHTLIRTQSFDLIYNERHTLKNDGTPHRVGLQLGSNANNLYGSSADSLRPVVLQLTLGGVYYKFEFVTEGYGGAFRMDVTGYDEFLAAVVTGNPSVLTGGTINAIGPLFNQTDGYFGITVDGVYTLVDGIDFTSAGFELGPPTVYEGIASAIQTAMGNSTEAALSAGTCIYNGSVFVITSGTTGVSSTITAVDDHASGVGTYIGQILGLEEPPAVLTQGS